ncbi:MAG: hypothetical protein NC489_32690, partial [Ruminococcus flavefaciens]|nr:hypothetical protein [Ruminococcus flavefaciens]
MIKHMSIKASSCLDMINALNSRISELDPSYVGASENCTECQDPVECGTGVCEDCGAPIDSGNKCPECQAAVEGAVDPAQQYIQGADGEINEEYIDEMMQYVADSVTENLDAVCSWRVEGDAVVFIVTGLNDESIEEYTCP